MYEAVYEVPLILPCLPERSPTSIKAGAVAVSEPLYGLRWPSVPEQLPLVGTGNWWMWYKKGPPAVGRPLMLTFTNTDPLVDEKLTLPETPLVKVALYPMFVGESVAIGAAAPATTVAAATADKTEEIETIAR